MSHNSQKNQRSLSYFFYQAIQEKIPNGIELRKKCIEHTTERSHPCFESCAEVQFSIKQSRRVVNSMISFRYALKT